MSTNPDSVAGLHIAVVRGPLSIDADRRWTRRAHILAALLLAEWDREQRALVAGGADLDSGEQRATPPLTTGPARNLGDAA